MPKMPTQEERDLWKRKLDPVEVINVVINEMHDEQLEQQLVDAGLAVKVQDKE